MTLHEYLSSRDLKPSAFAAEIGVPASTITRILNGERSPGLELMRVIRDKTAGAVTPNDFLPALAPTETGAAA
jgi:transcriptional regulator with XRE-family HTH domain